LSAPVCGLSARPAVAVIPPEASWKRKIDCGFARYARRHLIENFFCNLREFCRIAMRYDKADCSFGAIIYLT
jgi:transposase